MNIIKRNIKYFFIVTGIVLVWRGIWGLADVYLLPENQPLSFSLSIVLGIIVLLLVNPANKDIKEIT